jgi:FAD/FMN-containing dehydrogenase
MELLGRDRTIFGRLFAAQRGLKASLSKSNRCAMLRAAKRAVDPQGLLNPGVLIDP